MLEYIILGFLMGCAASGYDLKQYMAESTSYLSRVKEAGREKTHPLRRKSDRRKV